jgi:hypothetical protein
MHVGGLLLMDVPRSHRRDFYDDVKARSAAFDVGFADKNSLV